MTIKDLEAKCREKIGDVKLAKIHPANSGIPAEEIKLSPKLILQLIEERRLLARFCENDFSMAKSEYLNACALRDRVLQEIAECKS